MAIPFGQRPMEEVVMIMVILFSRPQMAGLLLQDILTLMV